MARVLALAGLAMLLRVSASVDAQAQRPTAPTLRTIEACRASLSEAGRAASFSATAFYEVVSDSEGKVSEVRAVKIPEVFNTFVQVAEFRGCVQRWRFSGAGATVVALSAGTTGELLEAWKISVSSGALTLVLPR
jgi:hypothetical protein